jgi:glycosyltransferase involved in cell wall biosynthesis
VSRILLDVSRLLTRAHAGLLPTGVDRVGIAYVKRYRMQARAVLSEQGRSIVLCENDSQRIFEMVLSSKFDRFAVARAIVRHCPRSIWKKDDVSGVLLHTSHSGMEFRKYHESMTHRKVRSVFMIHDLIPLTHAEYCRPAVDIQHRKRIRTALAHASGMIANSQDTLRALESEAALAGLPTPTTVVAHLASGVLRRAPAPARLAEPYFLMLGTIEPRKNHWFMLHIWRRIVEMLGDAAPKLVIVGRRGWECENAVDMLERCDAIRTHVIELSDCSDDELHDWMQHARALLFPAFVEGYGMPLVEALALNTPAIASNLRVFEEIAGNTPDYLDPLDGPGWIAAILDYAQAHSPARDAQLRRIELFREPTWDEHFALVDRFLETLPQ